MPSEEGGKREAARLATPGHMVGGDQVEGVIAHGALPVRVQEHVQLRVRLKREIGVLLTNNHGRACHVRTPAEARAALPPCCLVMGGGLDQVVGVVAHGALPVRVKECVQIRIRLQVEPALMWKHAERRRRLARG